MEISFLNKAFEGDNKWYAYLFVLLITFIGGEILGSIPLAIYSSFSGVDIADTSIPISNLTIVFILFIFVVMFCLFVISVKRIQKKKIISITTGRSRIDVKRIFTGVIIWGTISSVLFFAGLPFSDDIKFRFDAYQFIPLFFICLIMLPFQTTFEEFVFRGLLMQGSYLLFKNKWIALIATSILFAIMHGANPEIETYGFWTAMVIYFIIGLTLGLITILDNGMELAIGMHFINNFFSFIVISTEGTVIQAAGSLFVGGHSSIGLFDIITVVMVCLVFIFISKWIYKFKFSGFDTYKAI